MRELHKHFGKNKHRVLLVRLYVDSAVCSEKYSSSKEEASANKK